MYIFSNKYKLYALLTYKCFVALLFLFVTVFSHTAFHCLFIFNFFPLLSFFFGQKLSNTFQNVYICFVYAFSVHQVLCFSLPRHI